MMYNRQVKHNGGGMVVTVIALGIGTVISEVLVRYLQPGLTRRDLDDVKEHAVSVIAAKYDMTNDAVTKIYDNDKSIESTVKDIVSPKLTRGVMLLNGGRASKKKMDDAKTKAIEMLENNITTKETAGGYNVLPAKENVVRPRGNGADIYVTPDYEIF